MAKNVFILGAGASVHAGVPVMKEFYDAAVKLYEKGELEESDREHFQLVINAYSKSFRQIYANFNFEPELKNIETIYSLIDMAKTINKFLDINMDIDKLALAINKFIVRTIEKKTLFQARSQGGLISPSDYDYFMKKIFIHVGNPKKNLSCCIITFNYDIALDFVIEFYCGPGTIDYGLNDKDKSKENKLYKLHGSINWAKCINPICNNIIILPTKNGTYINLLNSKYIEMSKIIKNKKCPKCEKPLNESPILIPPTWNKSENKEIESVWRCASKELSEAKNIFIIGYSLPKTDLFFQYLLALGTLDIMNLERFWVFNKDPEVDKKFRNFLGNDMMGKYEFNGPKKDYDFNNLVNLLCNDRSILEG